MPRAVPATRAGEGGRASAGPGLEEYFLYLHWKHASLKVPANTDLNVSVNCLHRSISASEVKTEIYKIVAAKMSAKPTNPAAEWQGPMDTRFIRIFGEIAAATHDPKNEIVMDTFACAARVAGYVV